MGGWGRGDVIPELLHQNEKRLRRPRTSEESFMGRGTMYSTPCRFEEHLSCRGLKLESFNSLLSLALATRGCACTRDSMRSSFSR